MRRGRQRYFTPATICGFISFRRPTRAIVRTWRQTPNIAVTVQEDYQDWRKIKGIQLEGKVALVDGLASKAKAIAIYARKYPAVIKLFTDPTSGVYHKAFLKVKFYRVAPERLFYIDNEQGFGKRQELVLSQ